MKFILIGCPGAGKGTQAKKLSKHYDIAHISTGDLLRDQIKRGTELGKKITEIMDKGGLVSDDIVAAILKERITEDDCKKGYILDGYPRNVAQAEGLEAITGPLDKVVCIDVDDAVILDRMTGRRSCPKCGEMYHTKYNPPKTDSICDRCGESLIQRKDDNEETVKNRLKVYHETTAPVIDFYDKKGIVCRIDGQGDIDDIFKSICSKLEA
ncbi:MAG TPA: adenylate kinase [Lachnospiraceae bacterium]|nr:adenylate kinase [Lachnospiraceae bacterium]